MQSQKWIIKTCLILLITTMTGCSMPQETETISKSEVIYEEPPISDSEYTVITVDGGDLSGERQANVKVNIGFGDRVYWAYTNEYGQLVKVTADTIILQDEQTEPVNSNGRYYPDEAKVPEIGRAHV